MRLAENWKRFWTLNRHHAAGFTLVELIVVIAILAILAGVAVPAYSGYVTQANKQADQTLVAEVENALLLYYYSHPDEVNGGSVILSVTEPASAPGMEAAMVAAFGENWAETCKLKYDGWTNSQENIKNALLGSNFSDGAGGVNWELLGAVDNLTGQLSGVMANGLTLEKFTGYQQFLRDNDISASDTQLAANAAVLYLSQSSMSTDYREEVTKRFADPDTWGWEGNFELETEIKELALKGKCTEFEALAMVYATMQGYCMQQDKVNGNTELADKFAAIDLTTKSDGTTLVDDEIAVLNKLCEEFTAMVDNDKYDRADFVDYLYDNAAKDIEAYYGVIDGLFENQDTFMEKLNGEAGFFASQQGLLEAYWNLDEMKSGEVAVVLFKEDNAPQTLITGMSE